ncbi:MAG: hypothetical protein AAFX56_06190 [Pseudomonadota bacterium]
MTIIRPGSRRMLATIAVAMAMTLQGCSESQPVDRPMDRPADQQIASAADRQALFDYLLRKTLEREAFSPEKNRALGLNVEAAMRAMEPDVVNAATEEDLFYALARLSNARRDRHLSVWEIAGGLTAPQYYPGEDTPPAPVAGVRIELDYARRDGIVMFVADLATNAALTGGLLPGDLVVSINGVSPAERLEQWRPYMRYSTELGFRKKTSQVLASRTGLLPPEYYRETLDLEVVTISGNTRSVNLPYVERDSIEWQGDGVNPFPGFSLEASRPTFDLYLPDGDSTVIVLDWHRFHAKLVEDMDWLMEFAAANELLDHDIVFNATRSGGGSLGAYAIQRLSPKPFKTTFGNLRISDVIPEFISTRVEAFEARQDPLDKGGKETIDDGSWLIDWLSTDVQAAYDNGEEYTNNVPFKLAHAPKDSDGVIQPADVHFRGNMVCIFGPNGGSHLDQFYAIVTDNALCPTIGMETGGYSNTWEWYEEVVFPTTGKPAIGFMWNIGHTISPNGRIVEGDPLPIGEPIPLTHENFSKYDSILLKRALEILQAD